MLQQIFQSSGSTIGIMTPMVILWHLFQHLNIPLILLIASLFLFKLIRASHTKETRVGLQISLWVAIIVLIFMTHHLIWLLLGIVLGTNLPAYVGSLRNARKQRAALLQVTRGNQQQGNKQVERARNSATGSFQAPTYPSYYSYDEQPQAQYPQALPPQ